MIDHLMIRVSDEKKSRKFYDGVLKTLGYTVQMQYAPWTAYGPEGKAALWIGVDGPAHTRVHLAFVAPDRKAVHAFHAAAIKLGGKDNGAPGLRADYHPNYYGAFIFDPDGNNIEAVCHQPEQAPAKQKPAAKPTPAKSAAKTAAKSAVKAPAAKAAVKAPAAKRGAAAKAKQPSARR